MNGQLRFIRCSDVLEVAIGTIVISERVLSMSCILSPIDSLVYSGVTPVVWLSARII